MRETVLFACKKGPYDTIPPASEAVIEKLVAALFKLWPDRQKTFAEMVKKIEETIVIVSKTH